MDRSDMTGKILCLTLKIIYLLTGEDYVPIKRCDEDNITAPLHSSHERENNEKILDLTNKIIELLTREGEQDVKDEPVTGTVDDNNLHIWAIQQCKEEEFPIIISAVHSCQTISQDDDQNIPPVDGVQCKEEEVASDISSGRLNSSHMHQSNLGLMHITQNIADLPVGCSVGPPETKDAHLNIVVIDAGEGDLRFKEEEEEIPIGSKLDGFEKPLMRPFNSKVYLKNEDEESDDTETEDDEDDSVSGLKMIKSEKMETRVKIKREEVATNIGQGAKKTCPRQDAAMSTTAKKLFPVDRRLVTAEKPFFCPDCGGFFKHKSSLVLHRRIHSGEKPFSCSQCGKEFIQKANYIRHQRLHTGEKPYKCTECGKLYAQKQSLIMHQKFHAENEPFSCPECGENFMRQSHLVNHRKTHKGLKRYSCPDCGDFFMLRSSLVIHQRVHSAEKPITSL
ncbi:zinc finger protein 568-like [Hyla sarda]|uniref:zinc finger protein 568-like n=1 Tax=Hyla sarda TaxID=327740 RepID=UPI0024C424D1|nr:zinc finger protein 568-like [Hyla sarda]XP_056387638.1 zinc finger protein 568-like [Hyla sarda]XP_056387640.1 zinc finger protein 568-like [Hyla sarda]XP_056387641.1 zinc finger protein 568-like [Hyla sarda]